MVGTIQLRRIIEQPTQYETGISRKERIEIGREFLFGDIEYPIWDEDYRKVFETHFIRHFYFKEIAFETYEVFKFYLETWLQVNMPYYNKLYESEAMKFDPFSNTKTSIVTEKSKDVTTEGTEKEVANSDGTFGQTSNGQRDTSKEGVTNANTEGFNRQLESDTPQDRLGLTAEDGKGVIQYASKIEETRQTGNTSGTSNSTGNERTSDKLVSTASQRNDRDKTDYETENSLEKFVYEKSGKIGVQSYSKMLLDFRKTFIRIENQIFSECNELFLQIWL